MSFSKRKEVFVDVKFINRILKRIKTESRPVVFSEYRSPIQGKVYIDDRKVEFRITLKENGKVTTYITRKDETESDKMVNGAEAFRIMQKYYKTPIVKAPINSSGLLYYNKKSNKTRQYAYCYDLNSAYSFAMLQDMPDTENPLPQGIIEENQIGFDQDGILLDTGLYAYYRFPSMESPYKEFVNVWYNIKRTTKDKDEKTKAKNILNFSIGYLQRKNPFIRARILGYCNNTLKKLMDENTLMCSTDSLVSSVPRDDLDIGDGIGQWKLEKEGMFAHIGLGYQWDNKVSYRSVPKTWFKEGFDLLTDKLPKIGNVYRLNKEKMKLEEESYG